MQLDALGIQERELIKPRNMLDCLLATPLLLEFAAACCQSGQPTFDQTFDSRTFDFQTSDRQERFASRTGFLAIPCKAEKAPSRVNSRKCQGLRPRSFLDLQPFLESRSSDRLEVSVGVCSVVATGERPGKSVLSLFLNFKSLRLTRSL